MPTQSRDTTQSAGMAVMFTDIVGSTALAASLGDVAWADLLTRHHTVVRDGLRRHEGREMDTTGDGFFAVFSSAAHAVACALSVIEEIRALELELRAGVHAGDCVVVGDKCTGLAINIGARLCALATPGEVLVSQNVRDTGGPEFVFADRGLVEIRGVPGLWQVYAASR